MSKTPNPKTNVISNVEEAWLRKVRAHGEAKCELEILGQLTNFRGRFWLIQEVVWRLLECSRAGLSFYFSGFSGSNMRRT